MAYRALAPQGSYTLDQAAEQLGVSRRTVNRLVSDGALKVARLGHRTVRVRLAAIDELLLMLEQTTTSESVGDRRRGRKRT